MRGPKGSGFGGDRAQGVIHEGPASKLSLAEAPQPPRAWVLVQEPHTLSSACLLTGDLRTFRG